MILMIKKEKCEHLEKESYYNNNYYELPFSIDGASILFERYNSAEEFCGNVIGLFSCGKFVPMKYLHQYDKDDYFVIDSETWDKENKWT